MTGLNLGSILNAQTETVQTSDLLSTLRTVSGTSLSFGGRGFGRLIGPTTTPISLESEKPRWVLEFPFEPFYK